ncbi:putative damage-inducible protein DinB [Cytobacillus horneckiae]|uniref:DinB family protein n=1 Tax=Cytobacillus horneckiae TaxID=549687 RepID=UPI0019D15435|nr:DinB family protein [Cytobacillus horneckiae]MBN6885855.1 DinB family protein [Cytobacillus horneckiae]MCM3177399.1 DinB family protein [Cytobacillus horneckiae]
MVHAETVLLDQLLANANDESWYLSFEQVADGIAEADAVWKPDENSHSIVEIVQHLIYWNEAWQVRYEKNDVAAVPKIERNEDSFKYKEGSSYKELKEELLHVLLKWQHLLTAEKLEAEVPGYPVSAEWWGMIANLATHNAYHIGQIAYIKKIIKI